MCARTSALQIAQGHRKDKISRSNDRHLFRQNAAKTAENGRVHRTERSLAVRHSRKPNEKEISHEFFFGFGYHRHVTPSCFAKWYSWPNKLSGSHAQEFLRHITNPLTCNTAQHTKNNHTQCAVHTCLAPSRYESAAHNTNYLLPPER